MHHMTQFINHFVLVDQVWSYNMMGGLKESGELEPHVILDIYQKVGAYLMAVHNFHLTKDATQYNGFMFQLQEHLEQYTVGWRFFAYYFENLFRIISPSLGNIKHPITGVTPIITDSKDIEGFVFGT